MITLFLIAVILFAVYWYFRECHSVFSRLGIPGPKPSFLFGNVASFKDRFPLDVFVEWQNIYGKYFGYYEGLQPSMVISDPELTQQILIKKFAYFADRPNCTPFLYEGDVLSILNSTGVVWKQARSVVAKAFNSKSLTHNVPIVCEVSKRLVQKLEDLRLQHLDGFEITNYLERFTLDAFANAAFGYNTDSLNNDNELLLKYMKAFNHSGSAENPITGMARLFPSLTPLLKSFDHVHYKLHNEHLDIIRKLLRKENEKAKHEPNCIPNLLRRLQEGYTITTDQEKNEVKQYLSDEQVLAQSASLVGGGLGPSHSLIAYVVYSVATHPDVQHQLYEEIQNECPKHEPLTMESLSRLTYLDMVIEETCRLFPIIPGVARTCVKDCVINGVPFQRGMKVRVMCVSMYLDEKLYPEPHKFIPERFSKESKEARPSFSYFPFGFGPRMCPGYKFGLVPIKLAIVHMLRQFVITPTQKTEMPPQPALRPFLCPKNGIIVKLLPRETEM